MKKERDLRDDLYDNQPWLDEMQRKQDLITGIILVLTWLAAALVGAAMLS